MHENIGILRSQSQTLDNKFRFFKFQGSILQLLKFQNTYFQRFIILITSHKDWRTTWCLAQQYIFTWYNSVSWIKKVCSILSWTTQHLVAHPLLMVYCHTDRHIFITFGHKTLCLCILFLKSHAPMMSKRSKPLLVTYNNNMHLYTRKYSLTALSAEEDVLNSASLEL